jgi:hypothetical protein
MFRIQCSLQYGAAWAVLPGAPWRRLCRSSAWLGRHLWRHQVSVVEESLWRSINPKQCTLIPLGLSLHSSPLFQISPHTAFNGLSAQHSKGVFQTCFLAVYTAVKEALEMVVIYLQDVELASSL